MRFEWAKQRHLWQLSGEMNMARHFGAVRLTASQRSRGAEALAVPEALLLFGLLALTLDTGEPFPASEGTSKDSRCGLHGRTQHLLDEAQPYAQKTATIWCCCILSLLAAAGPVATAELSSSFSVSYLGETAGHCCPPAALLPSAAKLSCLLRGMGGPGRARCRSETACSG